MVEISAAAFGTRLKALFATRDVLFHNGTTVRRIRFGGRRQAAIAAIGAVTLGFSGYGAAAASGVVVPSTPDTELAQMQHQIGQMRQRVATIRETADAHARRIEQRQALITAALTGNGDAKALAVATPSIDPAADKLAADVVKPLVKVEGRQVQLAGVAQALLEKRYADTAATVRKLGLRPERIAKRSRGAAMSTGMGGPMIAANSEEASADLRADAQFRTLFQTWKKLDTLQQGAIAIPSVQPVHALSFTSNFGIRSDPFRGTAAMHAGVDIPGPLGTPIYATADGIVAHAGRQGGYGNMVELNHGKGIATRYGHLSKILVADHTRVTRGQLIALMGSTGRSTGSHLHYEVRIDGHAVNPVPFLTTADYLLAAQDRSVNTIPVSTTGPAAQD